MAQDGLCERRWASACPDGALSFLKSDRAVFLAVLFDLKAGPSLLAISAPLHILMEAITTQNCFYIRLVLSRGRHCVKALARKCNLFKACLSWKSNNSQRTAKHHGKRSLFEHVLGRLTCCIKRQALRRYLCRRPRLFGCLPTRLP